MKTRAVRLYGADDLRLEEFELPKMKENELLVKIITDSVCMSTYKLSKQGAAHIRTPKNLAENPAIIGHEMSGIIVDIGDKWKDKFHKGQKFTVQPALVDNGILKTAGYYYPYFGGDSTYSIIPNEFIEANCVIPFLGDSFFEASLSEPVSCIIAGYNRMYHTNDKNHIHEMGVKKGGKIAILGACGPMGLECTDYALQLENPASLVVAVDVSTDRLTRAQSLLAPKANKATTAVFLNSSEYEDATAKLMELSGGTGYDDVFVYAPITSLIELGDRILGQDGCLNFFAGPVDKTLSGKINMYNVHYKFTHIVGFTGSTDIDLKEGLDLMAKGRITPTIMVTHIGGLDNAIHTTMNVPNIPGGKKMIYPQIEMPLTAIDDFEKLGNENELFRQLANSCKEHGGCWNKEAEDLLLNYYHVDLEK